MARRFQKKVESFLCDNCGCSVDGNGFTNHCPRCLWSKHVDVFPGDREAECSGMMEPVGVENRGSNTALVHRCVLCGHTTRNKLAADDNFEMVLEITAQFGAVPPQR